MCMREGRFTLPHKVKTPYVNFANYGFFRKFNVVVSDPLAVSPLLIPINPYTVSTLSPRFFIFLPETQSVTVDQNFC